MLVGSIGWSRKVGDKVAKGEELGWFQVSGLASPPRRNNLAPYNPSIVDAIWCLDATATGTRSSTTMKADKAVRRLHQHCHLPLRRRHHIRPGPASDFGQGYGDARPGRYGDWQGLGGYKRHGSWGCSDDRCERAGKRGHRPCVIQSRGMSGESVEVSGSGDVFVRCRRAALLACMSVSFTCQLCRMFETAQQRHGQACRGLSRH